MRLSDGDGTVPLISTGLMCIKGWRGTKLNPSNIPIISREYKHQPSNMFKDLRYAAPITVFLRGRFAVEQGALCRTTSADVLNVCVFYMINACSLLTC